MGRFRIGLYATHAGIRTPAPSTAGSPSASPVRGTLPYPPDRLAALRGHSFGGGLKPRYIVGAAPLDQ